MPALRENVFCIALPHYRRGGQASSLSSKNAGARTAPLPTTTTNGKANGKATADGKAMPDDGQAGMPALREDISIVAWHRLPACGPYPFTNAVAVRRGLPTAGCVVCNRTETGPRRPLPLGHGLGLDARATRGMVEPCERRRFMKEGDVRRQSAGRGPISVRPACGRPAVGRPLRRQGNGNTNDNRTANG